MKKYWLPIAIAILAVIFLGLNYFGPVKNSQTKKEQSTVEFVIGALSQKYNRPANTVKVQVQADTGNFAKGLVNFTDEQGGAIWLAAKTSQGWELAFDGNGIAPCEAVNKYDFPKDLVPQCLDEQNNNNLHQR